MNSALFMNKTIGPDGLASMFKRTSTLGISPVELRKLPTMSKGPIRLNNARNEEIFRRPTKMF